MTQTVPVKDVVVAERLRPINIHAVQMTAESIKQNEMISPIICRRIGDEIHLVIGAHRLAAHQWLEIETIEVDLRENMSDDEARLLEIDENLIRNELNPLDRAIALHTRKEIYERQHPETKAGVAGGKARQNSATNIFSFAEDAAEKMRLSPKTVRRATAIVENLSDASVRRLRGQPIAEKEGELFALSKLAPEKQHRALDLIFAADDPLPTVKSAKAAIEGHVEPKPKPADQQFNKLMDAWNRAGKPARKRFLAELKEADEI